MEGLFSFGPFLINLKGPRLNCLSPRATSERVPLLNLSLLLSGPLTCAQRRNSAWISSARLCVLPPYAVDIFHGFNLCLAENKQQRCGSALRAVSWLAGWLAAWLSCWIDSPPIGDLPNLKSVFLSPFRSFFFSFL